MFVEITRLFTVVLVTAAGFMLGQDIGSGGQRRRDRRHARLPRRVPGSAACSVACSNAPSAWSSAASSGFPFRRCWPVSSVVASAASSDSRAPSRSRSYVKPEISLPAGGLVVWLCMYLGFRDRVAPRARSSSRWPGSRRGRSCARVPYDDTDGFLVDSSAAMDGQLLPLSRSGLFRDDLLVPRFVLDELQGMADAGDERGRRARRGLETLELLRREAPNRVYILDDEVPEVAEVDAKLVALARRLQLRLLTNDINLAKVAELQGVPTVIPRRLAADLVPGVLAGESIDVALNRAGSPPRPGRGLPRRRLDGRGERRCRPRRRRTGVARRVVDRSHERRPHRVRPRRTTPADEATAHRRRCRGRLRGPRRRRSAALLTRMPSGPSWSRPDAGRGSAGQAVRALGTERMVDRAVDAARRALRRRRARAPCRG